LILPGLELRPLGRPGRSQSLYRLRYPGSFLHLLLGFYLHICKKRERKRVILPSLVSRFCTLSTPILYLLSFFIILYLSARQFYLLCLIIDISVPFFPSFRTPLRHHIKSALNIPTFFLVASEVISLVCCSSKPFSRMPIPSCLWELRL
jgi:hypothetical protein